MIQKVIKFIGLVFIPCMVNSQQLIVQIEGDIQFNENLLTIREAGNDYPATLETHSSVYVSVQYDDQLNKKKNPNEPWRVFVHKQNMEWNENLSLKVRRTGKGSRLGNPGNPNIQNGDVFQDITNNPTYFFRGRGEIVQIPLAFELSGFSLAMGAGDFETSLVFTVYDDW
jgi:hypothetical protein